jgi:hypothetical protein
MYNILYAIQAMVGRGPSGHPANDSLPADREGTADSVERLMGTKAEARFAFISDKAEFVSDLLDV